MNIEHYYCMQWKGITTMIKLDLVDKVQRQIAWQSGVVEADHQGVAIENNA